MNVFEVLQRLLPKYWDNKWLLLRHVHKDEFLSKLKGSLSSV